MQLYDRGVEIRTILTLTSRNVPDKTRMELLGKLTRDYFHYPPCLAAFDRIDKIVRKRFELVNHEDLLADPRMEEEHRDFFRDSTERRAKNKKEMATMQATLEDYRKMRVIYYACTNALKNFEGEALDVDEMLTSMSEAIGKAHINRNVEEKFQMFGKQSNTGDLLEKVLAAEAIPMHKTGFDIYDEANGGVPHEGVMILAGTTSGGKSAILLNLLKYMYLNLNLCVSQITLEMSDESMMQRIISCVSGVEFYKIKQGKLNDKEKALIRTEMKKFNEHGKKNDCHFSWDSPTRGMTMDDALRVLKPFGFDVVGIDYVGLLEDADSDQQAKALSAMVRQAKVFSRETKSLVVILVQLDKETENIRYSRGMEEHADVVWRFNYSKQEQRELKVIPMQASKVRDGELINFDLGEEYQRMRVNNLSGGGGHEAFGDNDRQQTSGGAFNDDDDDDVPEKKKTSKGKKDDSFSKKQKKKKRAFTDDDPALR